ncbi:sodium/proton antiporter, CPA1 family [Streptomyces zhaozhouensis]|uniref:Sodium/proton antiporter, CPA1 family n=1 Tax=Streptomyces zhaozhouensis TaxID=1300267 RepID=A0A286DIT8_9ACTN|nr:Na+/H+ antiporter [Streptomyces zhaozhouensis]SOD58655.1 sodium/proton antiporter, CPA1 family [Streptomyces zhaozhouensis]
MDQLTLLFALLLGSVVTVPLAEWLRVPAPVVMTVLGGGLALLPAVPEVSLPPELILPLVLPPVLYAAVQRTSWRQFAANVRPILLLAVALVFVTTGVVAAVAQLVVPDLPLAPAVALGALVAPPDPVAATAVAGRLGLPRRMVSILEGEGLFNDVTAITLYHVAIAAAVTGSFSAWGAGGELVLSAVVAVLVGLVLGWLTARLLVVLGDATLRTGLTLLVPFAAYAVAEELHGSGVLSVLVAALFLGELATDPDDVTGRLTGQSFWAVMDLLVTGVAFGLIGLELNAVLAAAAGRWGELLPAAGLTLVAVVLVRLVWLLPAAWLAKRLHRGADLREDIPFSWRETVIMWWSGMRGVASVALALAVPLTVDDGGAFPERDAMVFVAFAVVVGTLLIQGLTLPWLATRLGVRGDSGAEEALEHELAVRAASAAKDRLREIARERELPEEVTEALLRRAYELGTRISPRMAEEERRDQVSHRVRRAREFSLLHAELLSAARRAVLDARAEPGTDPEVVDRVLNALDRRGLPHG